MSDPEAAPHAVARVLGVREAGRKPLLDHLAETFRARELLLILDNCEHLRAACAELAERLLGAQSRSRLLATSRIPLALAGETVYPLSPLATEDAAALFVQRAESTIRP